MVFTCDVMSLTKCFVCSCVYYFNYFQYFICHICISASSDFMW